MSKGRGIAFALLVGGAVAMVITAGVPWYAVDGAYGADGVVTFNGTDSTGGLAQALAVAILAGALLMLALGSTGRRIVAAVVAAIALPSAVVLPLRRPGHDEVMAELRRHTLADSYQLGIAGGNIGFGISALVVVAGAVLVLIRAHRWPQRVDRFARTSQRHDPAQGSGPSARTGSAGQAPASDPKEADPAALWRAIDEGQDPTTRPGRDD